MLPSADLHTLTLAGLAHRCVRETELFFQRQSHDPRYCFELFRRAIVERDERAWELVYAQYRSLVAGWVERHAAYPASGEEVQYFVNRAFEKMWVALPADRFSRFPDLKSLLRYLQMCVHSAVTDQARSGERGAMLVDVDVGSIERGVESPGVEDQVVDRLHGQALWERIDERLRDEKERRVVRDSFVRALKPAEIYAEAPDTFAGVTEVYRIKENVLARLRRDDQLKKLLGQDPGGF